MVKVWTHLTAAPRAIADEARIAETQGWDGLGVVDSQNRSGDPYVALTMAATVTERVGLSTAVTNSVTRMAAATGAAARRSKPRLRTTQQAPPGICRAGPVALS